MIRRLRRPFGAPTRRPAAVAARIQHETDQPTALLWLCPARLRNDLAEPCLRPLPCAEHNVPDQDIGLLLYGCTYHRRVHA